MQSLRKGIFSGLLAVCGLLVVPGMTYAQPRDCSKAPENMKAQCEARNKADAKCGKLEGDARRICQRDELPRDCTKESDRARCEGEVAAHKACRGDAKTYRKCFESKRPAAKKADAGDPVVCCEFKGVKGSSTAKLCVEQKGKVVADSMCPGLKK